MEADLIVIRGLAIAATLIAGLAGCAGGARATGSAPYPCDDGQWQSDQRALAGGTLSGNQLVDICGPVTRVLAARRTRSGDHGYFFVRMPSGYQLEIVANLDAMAAAPAGAPPPDWPWVVTGDYVYVQGRYYYDSAARQGVDWTEDDVRRSWPHTGYVAVCNASGANCSKYW